ncbi:unnamed protein product [Closterium sp. Naga37s-1]|nr:unnamed protein product [Closterium sp. Naga37s-1]
MIIRVTCESEGGAQCPQWALVELQGELRADLPALASALPASALRGNDGGNGLEKSVPGTAEGGGAGDCDAGRAWEEGCTPIGVLTCPRQGAVRLTVGHHQLEGAMATLPKPLVLLRKTATPLPPHRGQRAATMAEAERGAGGVRVGAEGMDVEGGRQEGGDGEGAAGQGGAGGGGEKEASVGYRVEGVIRCKLIFKTRPKLVLAGAR